MKSPSLGNFFLRVGGLAAVFVISLAITKQLFPGHESGVVIAISFVVISASAIKAVGKRKTKK